MSEKIKFRHIHQYERAPLNHNIYRCTFQTCRHYQHRQYLIGKEALCNNCGAIFILDETQIGSPLNKKKGNKSPVCLNCSKSKKAKVQRDLKEKLEKILSSQLGIKKEDYTI